MAYIYRAQVRVRIRRICAVQQTPACKTIRWFPEVLYPTRAWFLKLVNKPASQQGFQPINQNHISDQITLLNIIYYINWCKLFVPCALMSRFQLLVVACFVAQAHAIKQLRHVEFLITHQFGLSSCFHQPVTPLGAAVCPKKDKTHQIAGTRWNYMCLDSIVLTTCYIKCLTYIELDGTMLHVNVYISPNMIGRPGIGMLKCYTYNYYTVCNSDFILQKLMTYHYFTI